MIQTDFSVKILTYGTTDLKSPPSSKHSGNRPAKNSVICVAHKICNPLSLENAIMLQIQLKRNKMAEVP